MHKIYNNIALANKARKVILGSDEIVNQMKNNNLLVFISSTASINSFKLIQNKANTYDAEVIILNDIEENLNKIFGGKKVKILAIKDKGFIKLIKSNIKE